MPVKECPKCNRKPHTAARECVCGHEFYEKRTLQMIKPSTVHVDNSAILIQEVLPPDFEFLGNHPLKGSSGAVIENLYYARSTKVNNNEPFTARSLKQLVQTCYRIQYRPNKTGKYAFPLK